MTDGEADLGDVAGGFRTALRVNVSLNPAMETAPTGVPVRSVIAAATEVVPRWNEWLTRNPSHLAAVSTAAR
ncbi:hypothetical protein QRX50_13305 [Amycolatopsis carbonis]|uniref:Uncharacterized protein n=1 Tax=Amycolatopsis carbonis TaxID=715471 RepID=A0A9Y2ILV8_9PSEU|nr:hypothetical protein [Amycolatopsis sp. 2-15]WIX81661.1 hypothetical protein QRX50_13305 [Amycolatopsis sp. 2-15]